MKTTGNNPNKTQIEPKNGPELMERLDELDAKVDRLSILIETHLFLLSDKDRPRVLLVGWREIALALRKSASSLRRYVRKEGLPVLRWGRHVCTTPRLVEDWLLAREQRKRQRQWKPHPDSYEGPRSQGLLGQRREQEAKALTERLVAG